MPSPKISVIIPARDEEQHLPDCLESIARSAELAAIEVEVIVVLNRCTDRTEEIAVSAGCRIVRDESKNLACIRNTGAREALGEILVTVDADSRMSPNALRRIRKELEGRVIGGGVFILPARWSLGIFLTGLCIFPIALWYRISGGLFFCRREDFHAIGGFNEELHSVEDIDFARRLRAYGRTKGMKFINLYRVYIVTSCRKFDKLGDWYFLKHPAMFLRLLRGKDREGANRIWYDFER